MDHFVIKRAERPVLADGLETARAEGKDIAEGFGLNLQRSGKPVGRPSRQTLYDSMLGRLLLSGEVEIAWQLTTKAVPAWWKVGMPLSLEPPKAF
eukprot:4183847-Amphidinium_carterae.1